MDNMEKNCQKGLVVLDKVITVIWLTPRRVLCPRTGLRFDHFISATPTRGGGTGCLGSAVGGEGHDSPLYCVLEAARPVDCANRRSQSSEAPGTHAGMPALPGSFLCVCVCCGCGRGSLVYAMSLPSYDEIPTTLN